MDDYKQAAANTHRAIGRFMSEFSQAEYAIRHHLAEEINLSDRFFDAVVGGYDVALLCSVAKAVFAMERDQESAAVIGGLLNKFRQLTMTGIGSPMGCGSHLRVAAQFTI